MSLKSLLFLDLIFVIQFILFLQWYNMKTYPISCITAPFNAIELLFSLLEVIGLYALSGYTISKF